MIWNANRESLVGGKDCLQTIFREQIEHLRDELWVLSKNAVLAMNAGAKIGSFAQNTGEGGLSPYHLQPGGDLIWQIGTAYFGCRTENGEFDPELFQQKATLENVKMIEIKLSQGAKPGHGGILPAAKEHGRNRRHPSRQTSYGVFRRRLTPLLLTPKD